MAYMAMAYIVMVYIVMAYIVMAYMVMALDQDSDGFVSMKELTDTLNELSRLCKSTAYTNVQAY